MSNYDRIENDFSYHPPASEDVVEYFTALRSYAKNFAHLIDSLVPDGREKSLALTRLEEAVMWANAGLARSQETQ